MNTYLSTIKSLDSVKMSLTRGQSAWAKSPSETQRSAFSSGCRLSNGTDFNNWLVGMTDGDGTFHFSRRKKNTWTFTFKISQSSYNLRCLFFIKSNLGVGSIIITKNDSMAIYKVRKQEHLINNIIPIFNKHPLLTHKYHKYFFFKEALQISNRSDLSMEEKDRLILELKLQSEKPLSDRISTAWNTTRHDLKSKEDATKVMHKFWLVGFTEAEGSFYIVKKDSNRLVHCFEITQKHDLIVLTAIALIFDLKVTKKKTYLTVVTVKQKAIKVIIDFFFKTMKGMKSLEYRLWARSFNKRKRGFEYLSKMRDRMRKIRSIRYDKNFKRIHKK